MSLLRLYIITGEQGAGKTLFLSTLVTLLKKNKIIPGGILARGEWENNKRSGFQMEDLSSGQQIPLASLEKCKNWYSLGKFYFKPSSLSQGDNLLQSDEILKNKIIILDEIGPFELKGEVWANGLNKLLNTYSGILILSVRKTLIREVISHWNLQHPEIIDISKIQVEEMLNKIKEILKGRREG